MGEHHHIRTTSNTGGQEDLRTNSIPNMEDLVDRTLSRFPMEEPPMINNCHSVELNINTLLHQAGTLKAIPRRLSIH